MKVVTQQTLGGPDVLETAEVPVPTPRQDQVLIRLRATSVNPVDCKLRAGQVGFLGEPPFTLGFDLAGTVTKVGEGVSEFRSGDEVFGMVFSRPGTYGEYVAARADSLTSCPSGLNLVTAAALPTAALTAWQALDLAGVRSDERILVHGAAGGVGHLAVQFAKLRGAQVIGTARAVNHEFLRDLGIDGVIDYTATDFTTAVRDVDVVLDLVGGEYGSRSLRVLSPGGRYVTAQQSDAGDDSRAALVTGRPSRSNLVAIGKLVETGRVRVHVDRVMSLADAAEAHRLSESGHVRGKLVLTPW